MFGLVVQLILSLIASVIAGTILHARKAPRTVSVTGSVLAAVLILAGTIWLATRPAPPIQLRIVTPSDGDDVGLSTLVQGEVAPISSDVYVLVHPLSTDRWWVQNLPFVQNDGRWQVRVYTGTETEGIGELYEILAVATNENRLIRILRGDYPIPGQQLEAIPPYLAKSNLIVVRRSR